MFTLWNKSIIHRSINTQAIEFIYHGRTSYFSNPHQSINYLTYLFLKIDKWHLHTNICAVVVTTDWYTVYPKKYAHDFVVLCFVVVTQSFIMNSHEVFIHIHQGCFAGTGAIVRLPQCQWSKPGGYGKISQCITTTKYSKAKTCAYFLGYTVWTFVYWHLLCHKIHSKI